MTHEESTMTLDKIVKYLSSTPLITVKKDHEYTLQNSIIDDKEVINFPPALPKNETETVSKFNDWLMNLLKKWDDEIYRIGLNNDKFYFTLLYCLDKDFDKLTVELQGKYVMDAIITSYRSVSKKGKDDVFQKFEYKKLGWSKSKIIASIKHGSDIPDVIRFTCDFFSINIIVFNSDHKQIQVHYGVGKFNPFQETLFLIKTKTGYNPIVSKNKRTWNYNDSFFIEFMNEHRKKFTCWSYSHKDDIDKIRQFRIQRLREEKEEDQEHPDDVFHKNMNLEQLRKYAIKAGIQIKIGKTFVTKQILYELLEKKKQNST